MPANLENSPMATGLENVGFHSNSKECSNYHTVALNTPANLENSTVASQFSFQSQRKEMPKHVQTTIQLHSSYTLAK